MQNSRKKTLLVSTAGLSFMLLAGCLDLQLGGGSKNEVAHPTVGQQLMDLQKARTVGAITEPEYQTQKAKILEGK